jgi:hypothetical protein
MSCSTWAGCGATIRGGRGVAVGSEGTAVGNCGGAVACCARPAVSATSAIQTISAKE